MENQYSQVKSKSSTLSKVRIPVTIALVICLFTPWLSGCGGPYPGWYVILVGGINPLSQIPEIPLRPVFLLAYPAAISMILYPILNLWKAISRKGSTSWLSGSLIGSILFLALVALYKIIYVYTELLWGYWLTWLVILTAGIIEALDKRKPKQSIDQPQQFAGNESPLKSINKFLIGIVVGIVVLVVTAFAIALTPRAPTLNSSFDVGREFRYQGEDAAKKGNYDEAIANFSKAIELDPRNTDLMNAYSYLGRGDAYYEKGNYDQAIADYSKLITLDSRFQAAYHHRGKAYKSKGNLDRAMADFNKAIELDPKYAECYRDRGVAYRQQGLGLQAIADFQMYLTLAPNASDRAQVERWIAELK